MIANLSTESYRYNSLSSLAGANFREHASDFTITRQPIIIDPAPIDPDNPETDTLPPAPDVAPADEDMSNKVAFTVTLAPSAHGPRDATISIESADSVISPYSFAVGGTGLAPLIEVTSADGQLIADGDESTSLSDGTNLGRTYESLHRIDLYHHQ